MKTTRKLALITPTIFLSMTMVVSSCQKDETSSPLTGIEKTTSVSTKTRSNSSNCNCIINPSPTVTQAEIDMLVYMREEEKLARDVYQVMWDHYHIPIFKNISRSEQHHMDQVLCLLQYYDIPDPASPDPGVFNNSELQELYNDLIEQGSVSLTEALTVGATIEDKDIFDLETDMSLTSNPAILNIFGHLSCASGNHIRSFSALLDGRGVTYVPQYISQEVYDAIISLPHQHCGGQ